MWCCDQRSAARPWRWTARREALKGSMPWARSEAMVPVRTSPVPPVARAAEPVLFSAARLHVAAIWVLWPLSTTVAERASARA